MKNDQYPLKTINLPGIGQQSQPLWIESNKSVLICATHTFIIGYDLMKFDEKFFITNCYSSLPFALSTRWLAFADVRLNLIHQSSGGIDGTISEQNSSLTSAVLTAAKVLTKGVTKIGESVMAFGAGTSPTNSTTMTEKNGTNQQTSTNSNSNNSSASSNPARHRHNSVKDETQPGILTIVDTVKLFGVRFR